MTLKKVFFGSMMTLMVFLGAVSFALPTVAADDIQSSSSRVTVVPPKFELKGSPGESIEQFLKITNEDDEEAIIALSVENVKVIGEEGEVKLLGENSPKDQFSLANWITFSNKSMRMKPKETNTVNFRIAIPKDIEPGGKYASIVISMDRINRAPKESGASVKVVSLVMVSVSGDIREEAVIESFSPINNLVDGFVDFDLRMKNKGNSHIRPEGTIVITNFWGKKVGEVALESENVLPSATRKMMTRWQPNKLLIGRYTATLVSSYGEKHNTPISATTAFFARTDLILLMALMIGAAFFSPLLVFRRKRKNSKVTGIMSLFRKTSAGSQADK